MMEAIDTVIDEAMSDSVAQFQQDRLEQTREALEQAEIERLRLATVLDYIPACVWVSDAEGNLISESVDSAEAQGFHLEDLETRINLARGHEPYYQIYDRDGKPVPPGRAPAVRALQGEAFRGEEFYWRNALGERAYLVSAVPMQDAFGQITGAVVVALDMTDQRRLENAIRESDERYRVTVENAAIGINQLGLDGCWHRVNARYGEIVGRDPKTIEGTPVSDLTHPEDHAELAAEMEALLRGEVERVRRELRQFSGNGETVWVEMTLSPAFDEQGNLGYLVAIVQDVSTRKQAELLTTRYQMLSERSRDIILFIHPEEYRIIEANEAAVRAYGYPREQLLGMSLRNLRAEETLREMPEQFATASREGLLLETIHKRRNGETFPVEVSAQGADVGGERLVLSIIREITDRKRLEEDLARQRHLAEESSRHKTRLLT
ncbi:MAG TPA: PAS domain S-box protein, partial [Isosphaeraceae bacterium]|nr:PAS domain S-box protein [Isosphaeraceae bacterium]